MRIDKELNAMGRILRILSEFPLPDRVRIGGYIMSRVATTRSLVEGMAIAERKKIINEKQEPLFAVPAPDQEVESVRMKAEYEEEDQGEGDAGGSEEADCAIVEPGHSKEEPAPAFGG